MDQHGQVLGGGAPLPAGPHLLEPRQRLVGLPELDVELSLAEQDPGVGGLTERRGLGEFLGRPLEVARLATGLVELAGDLVQRALELGGDGPLGELAEERIDDRRGLLGIAGLEDGPGGPELVLRVEVPLPQGVLEVLAAQGLFIRQHQRHAVPGLGLGDARELGRGLLEMAQGRGAELGLRGTGRLGLLSRLRDGPDQARLLQIDRPLEQVAHPLEPRLRRGEQGLDVGRGLLESGRVILLRQGHLHRHGVQAHHRGHARRPRRRGHVKRVVDHLQAAIALLPEPEMVRVGQVDLEVGLLPLEHLLEDRLQVDVDRLDLGIEAPLPPSATFGRPRGEHCAGSARGTGSAA